MIVTVCGPEAERLVNFCRGRSFANTDRSANLRL
jgi:hypothetical protein